MENRDVITELEFQKNNLLCNLTKYDKTDLCFTGNPQITHSMHLIPVHDYKKHTNFQYGFVNLIDVNGLYKTTLDIVKYLIIICDDINDITCVNFVYGDTNFTAISIERLKIIDKIIKKVFFKMGDKTMIKIALSDIILVDNIDRCIIQGYLNITNDLNIYVESNTKNIQLQIYGTVIDNVERCEFMENICENIKYNKTANLPIKNINSVKNEYNRSLKYNFSDYLSFKYNNIIVELPSIDLIDNISFLIDNRTVEFDKNSLIIYNDMYDKIIFNNNEKCLIKIPYTIESKIDLSILEMTVNLNECEEISVYVMRDSEIIFHDINPLILHTLNFNTCVQHFQMNSIPNNININIKQMHVKEIIITCKKNQKYVKPINEFIFELNGGNRKITKIDCDIYQQLHHIVQNENAYTIGFCLYPNYIYPNGQINLEKLIFSHDSIEEFTLDIYLVGYNVQ